LGVRAPGIARLIYTGRFAAEIMVRQKGGGRCAYGGEAKILVNFAATE